jgi:hypothetical protein
MKLAEHKLILHGRLETAWNKLVDWQHMPEWDTLMKSVHFDGPLQLDSVGQLTLKSDQVFTLRVTSFTPLKNYTDEFSTFGSRFMFHHELTPVAPGEIELSIGAEAEGLAAFILQYPLSIDFTKKLPGIMSRFKEQFEKAERALA